MDEIIKILYVIFYVAASLAGLLFGVKKKGIYLISGICFLFIALILQEYREKINDFFYSPKEGIHRELSSDEKSKKALTYYNFAEENYRKQKFENAHELYVKSLSLLPTVTALIAKANDQRQLFFSCNDN